jgi:hypothetical protein
MGGGWRSDRWEDSGVAGSVLLKHALEDIGDCRWRLGQCRLEVSNSVAETFLVAGVRPVDLINFVIVACLLAVVAGGATVAPAIRALRVDPAVALGTNRRPAHRRPGTLAPRGLQFFRNQPICVLT